MKVIPVDPTLPHQLITSNLDGVNFVLSFDWNDRAQRWCMDVNDSTGSPICAGTFVVVQTPLMLGCNDIRRPIGDFVAINAKNPNNEAGLTDLGGDVTVLYVTAAELKAL